MGGLQHDIAAVSQNVTNLCLAQTQAVDLVLRLDMVNRLRSSMTGLLSHPA